MPTGMPQRAASAPARRSGPARSRRCITSPVVSIVTRLAPEPTVWAAWGALSGRHPRRDHEWPASQRLSRHSSPVLAAALVKAPDNERSWVDPNVPGEMHDHRCVGTPVSVMSDSSPPLPDATRPDRSACEAVHHPPPGAWRQARWAGKVGDYAPPPGRSAPAWRRTVCPPGTVHEAPPPGAIWQRLEVPHHAPP
jgi:hypothetical protein